MDQAGQVDPFANPSNTRILADRIVLAYAEPSEGLGIETNTGAGDRFVEC